MAKVRAKVIATDMGYYDTDGQGPRIVREGQTFTFEGPKIPFWVKAIGKIEKIEDASEAKVSAKEPVKAPSKKKSKAKAKVEKEVEEEEYSDDYSDAEDFV